MEFPLPDGTFAYGRALRDSSVAFYLQRSSEAGTVPSPMGAVDFVVGVYNDVLTSDWASHVGSVAPSSGEDEWPPPQAIYHPGGGYSVYDRGLITRAEESEIEGLEVAAVWNRQHLTDRLLGRGDKWLPRRSWIRD